jgi:Ca2+-binding RTX toxin-like protein
MALSPMRRGPQPAPPMPPAPPATNDLLQGDARNNVLVGGGGNDTLNGGAGTDTADYSGLGNGVTLLSQGVVGKGNAGTDLLIGIERIIGATGKANLIDGTVANPAAQTTSFKIDLGASSLQVNGVPFLGTLNFVVDNFTQVRGTNNADVVTGAATNDIFFGSAGNDTYNGAAGTDTVDYSTLGSAVTLRSQGVINKGALGQDTIQNIEKIIGATGQANLIDGTVANPATQTTSFAIDIALGKLVVNGVPGLGSFAFDIGNFSNVTGTNNADTIRGDAKANLLLGAGGNDTITGAGGDDTIAGGAGADRISLGSGRDTVVFNNAAEGGDLIIDFRGREDHIEFSAAGFGLNAGVLPGSEFAANRAGVANRAEAQFVYDTDDGQLYFDADGTGAGQSVLLATLQGAPGLSLSDLILIA